MTETRTTCPYCGVGCGVIVGSTAAGFAVRGDPDHPANRGKLCVKGSTLAETLDDRTRLTRPVVDGQPVEWGSALDHVAAGLRQTIEQYGPDSVAFYVSGQLLTEDYYVANKLVKGFLGTGNIDTNSRLCMSSSVAGHNRAFGEDVVPGIYDDWDEADLVLLVGSNTAWCHPILFQRLEAARAARGTYVITLDPRRTATSDGVDEHLGIRPGGDVALFQGLLVYLADHGHLDHAYIAAHTEGVEAALAAARVDVPDIAAAVRLTGLTAEQLTRLFVRFAATPRALTVYSQGVNQSSAGTDKVNAILNCHLATGRIGRPGCGPFSVTGQPNAMGGREVGGLANMLAAHRRWENAHDVATVAHFWNAPRMARGPGLKAVEMFEAVADGRIKAIWIMATNPAASMPRADEVRAALAACPLVIVSDCWDTDTTRLADVVLPAAGWGEKNGTVTNSERMISRQRPFRAPVGEAKADWWIMAEVARRMGFAAAFSYEAADAVFREHAALSALDPAPDRLFTLGPLQRLDRPGYDDLSPCRWPVRDEMGAGRLYGDGHFSTPSRRARFVPVRFRAPQAQVSRQYPFLLNTGRLRDQWHTMTRTGLAPKLMRHQEEPFLELAPVDARKLCVGDRDLVRVSSEHGDCVLRVRVTEAQMPGQVFVPIHWTSRFTSAGSIARLVQAAVDPQSGQPEMKVTAVRLAPVPSLWRGSLAGGALAGGTLAGGAGKVPDGFHATRVTGEAADSWELAGWDPLPEGLDLTLFAEGLLGATSGRDVVAKVQPDLGLARFGLIAGGRIVAALALATRQDHALPTRDDLLALIGRPCDAEAEAALFAVQPATERVKAAPKVCTCFGVSRAAIETAAREGARDADAVGARTKAGTNCGSCRSEIKEILRQVFATA